VRLKSIVLLTMMFAACGGPAPSNQNATQSSASDSAPAAVSQVADPDTPEGRLLARPWSGDLDGMIGRRYLRILVIPDKMNFFFDGSQMRGATYDAMTEFEKVVNSKFGKRQTPIAFVFVPTRRSEIVHALVEGRGDIAAGNLGISDARKEMIDFSVPVRDHVKLIPVGGPDAPPINSLEDLAGKTVYIPKATAISEVVEKLNEKFRAAGRAPIVIEAADENLEPSDILEMVNAGIVPLTLSDSLAAEFWAKVFKDLHPYSDVVLTETAATGWAIRKGSPKLKAAVDEFVKTHGEGTVFGNTVLRTYLGNTKWVRNATAGRERQKFEQMVRLFRKYGDQADLPYLLVTAQAYQESGLDQSARSPVGAVGVMQIKPSTAAGKPIEVKDVEKLENNIKAGTKYLRFLVDQYYADEPMDRVTKGVFAIASYNAGPARIRQLRKKAEAQGLDPNRWFNNVELVAAREIGRETVQYVANIYKYYLAYKMLIEREARKAGAVGTTRTPKNAK
jgi:membrane-bound lytic murein transglycosylase MltF